MIPTQSELVLTVKARRDEVGLQFEELCYNMIAKGLDEELLLRRRRENVMSSAIRKGCVAQGGQL